MDSRHPDQFPGRGTNMTEFKKRDRGMERATNITRQKPKTAKNSEAQENTKHKDQDNFYQRNKQQVQNQT